mmetsp:Transcript_9353/g.20787  ORF Transcript_9353/g.20787 Transcript_9353/m.20787 type:complete len:370 (-) Transcript_9353:645-1754(-)
MPTNLRREAIGEILSNFMKLLLHLWAKNISRVNNLLQHSGMSSLHMSQESPLESLNVLNINPVTVSLHSNEKRGNNLLGLIGLVLSLLKKLVKTNSTVKLLLSGGVQIRTELCKGSNLTVLSQLKLHGTGNRFGGLVLSGGSDTRHGQTDRNGRTLSLVEQFGLQKDLSIGNGNHIGGNVSGHISSLGLNDWKGGQRSTPGVAVHLGGTLEEARVEVKHISGVGLTTGGTTEQERHLTVCHSLLGEIIVKDDGVLSVVAKVFSHGGSGVGSEELKRSGVGGGSSDDDAVVHGLLVIELSDELGDGGSLLSHTDVDTGEGILLRLLVNNGVNGNRGLSSLTISNDQFTLSTSNGDKSIHGLESGKHGFAH